MITVTPSLTMSITILDTIVDYPIFFIACQKLRIYRGNMQQKKKKPPSREKYEENNPNWTARLSVELKDEITTYLENSEQRRRDFMAIALKKQVADYEQARTQGYNDGYANGYKQSH